MSINFNILRTTVRAFYDLVYPPCCALCKDRIYDERGVICDDCEHGLLPIEAPYCERCGQSLATPVSPCSACPGRTFYFDGALSGFQFNTPLQDLTHQLKYRSRPGIGRFLGSLLGKRVEREPAFPHIVAVVPVPLHSLRRRERGYNQSEYIAQGISDETGIPVLRDVLVRNRNTPTQTSLTPDGRAANVEGVFDVIRTDAVRGSSLVLVDDVFTTGATINSGARSLILEGAERVFALTIARA